MVRWEHRYTHNISTNVSPRMSTDRQLCMRPMPIAGCAMSRVKTTAMSVFSISSPHSKLRIRLHIIEHKGYRKSFSMKSCQRKIKSLFKRSCKKKIYCKVLVHSWYSLIVSLRLWKVIDSVTHRADPWTWSCG